MYKDNALCDSRRRAVTWGSRCKTNRFGRCFSVQNKRHVAVCMWCRGTTVQNSSSAAPFHRLPAPGGQGSASYGSSRVRAGRTMMPAMMFPPGMMPYGEPPRLAPGGACCSNARAVGERLCTRAFSALQGVTQSGPAAAACAGMVVSPPQGPQGPQGRFTPVPPAAKQPAKAGAPGQAGVGLYFKMDSLGR